MSSGLSAGKQKGREAVAGSRGIIAAIAIGQRSALRSLFSRAMGVEAADVPPERLSQFKEAVSAILTPHATAILLDPEYGLPAAARRSRNAGLLLAYEQTGYDKSVPGRLPRLLDRWSVNRLIEAGANAVKMLLYYSSRSSAKTNDLKHAFVEKVGAECAASDTPFLLELVSYPDNMDEKGTECARIKPEAVAESVREFSKPGYRVDVLKVGVPVNMDFVEGSPSLYGEPTYSRSQALEYCRRAAAEAGVPFIYLSHGVANETFQYALELAGSRRCVQRSSLRAGHLERRCRDSRETRRKCPGRLAAHHRRAKHSECKPASESRCPLAGGPAEFRFRKGSRLKRSA
jgi:tagatose 1,6-diphosphate aldolase